VKLGDIMIDAFELLHALKKKYRTQLELAEALGLKQSNVSRIMTAKRGKEMRADTYAAILDLATKHGMIAGDDEPRHRMAQNDKMIPQIDATAGLRIGSSTLLEVSSGNGFTYAKEAIRGSWMLPEQMLSRVGVASRHIVAFASQGASMVPTIEDGDVVFIDTRHRVPSPPDIYALEDQFGGVIIKRLQVISEPGAEVIRVLVSSDNPRHGSMELDLDQITIIGRKIGRFTT
jgi:phage repressor protein C with HTH and peptisase S24 domain